MHEVPTERKTSTRRSLIVAGLSGAGIAGALTLLLWASMPAAALENGGHEFWAADLPNYADYKDLGIAVINADSVPALVEVWDASGLEASGTVAVGGMQYFIVSNGMIDDSTLNTIGTHRVTSDQRIGVVQFNPLHNVYTNDASLLLPLEKWGTEYRVTAQAPLGPYGLPSYLTVTTNVATCLTVTPSVTTTMGTSAGAVASIPAGVTTPFCLLPFQRLNLEAIPGDLTGSVIRSELPVAVYAGSTCANIPTAFPWCDHVSEQLLPVKAWDVEFPLCRSQLRSAEPDIIRLHASAPATTVSVTDGGTTTPYFLPAPGSYIDVPVSGDGLITANAPIHVMDNLVGYSYSANDGDPAIVQIPGIRHWTDAYRFVVPPMTNVDFVSVVAPAGTSVALDGIPVAGFAPITGTGYQCVRVSVADGLHFIQGDREFEIFTHGYDDYDSYAYPGGVWTLGDDNVCQLPTLLGDQAITIDPEDVTLDVDAILDCLPPPPPPPCADVTLLPSEWSTQEITVLPSICCYEVDPDLPKPAPDDQLPRRGYCVDPPCLLEDECEPPPCSELTGGLYITGTSIAVSLVRIDVGGIDPCAPCPSLYFFAGTTGLWVQGYVNVCEINCEDLVYDATGNAALTKLCQRAPGDIDLPPLDGVTLPLVDGISLPDPGGLPSPCAECLDAPVVTDIVTGLVPRP